jgi:hypothetical protein
MIPAFRVPDLPQASIGSFRNMSECPPVGGSTVYAYRRELPLSFRIERRVKDFLTLQPSKKEREKEATR